MHLYGADAYARTTALREKIIAPYLAKHQEGSVTRFYLGEEGAFLKLREFAGTGSLFAKVKLVVLYEVSEIEEKLEKELILFLKNLLEDKATTAVIVAEKKLPKAFDFLLKEPVKKFEFNELKESDFLSFLKKESLARGLKVSDAQIRDVAKNHSIVKNYVRVGDSWGAITDLEKISFGGFADISAPDFFPLIQTIKDVNSIGAKLKALWYLLENNDPTAIFNILASQVYGSSIIKMADYDIAIKSGKLEQEEALLDFALTS